MHTLPHEVLSELMEIVRLCVQSGINAERERCVAIVERAIRDDYKAKTGHEREMSEVEGELSRLIRSGLPFTR